MIKYNKVILSLLILLIGAKTIARDNNPQNQRKRQRRHNSPPPRNNSEQNRLHSEPQKPYKYERKPRRLRPNTRREKRPRSQVAKIAREHRYRVLASKRNKKKLPFSTILLPVAQSGRRRRK